MIEHLTERELEVARLVDEGMTNAEIADALVIEESTVASHVHHILAKLALKNRVEVTKWYGDHKGDQGAQEA